MRAPPTYLIRRAPSLSGVMTESERRTALSALDRIEATLGQDEFSDIGPVDTGAFTSPSDFDLPSQSYGALPYSEPTPSSGGWFTDLTGLLAKLLPVAGSAAAGLLKQPAGTTLRPAYGAGLPITPPATSTGIPWWGWALLGLGGLGAVGISFAILRRVI